MHMRKPVATPRSSKTRRTIAVALACLTFVVVVSRAFSGVRRLTTTSDSLSLTTSGKTLVVHIFADTDPEYLKNLRFFIQWGIDPNDDADYIVVVQNIESKTAAVLPDLPKNAQYVQHNNECYDWGTFGWLLLHSGHVKLSKYKYIVLTNSSVRGPYIPPYIPLFSYDSIPTSWVAPAVLQKKLPWHRLLTQRLTNDVKLVGPVISCEGSPFQGNVTAHWRTNPHVQSYILAMDQEALQILIKDNTVLNCYNDRWDAVYFGELGSSLAVLKAGKNIDSFLPRYQNVDWRSQNNWGCNGGINPTGEMFFDGVTLSAYDVLFVKMKSLMLAGKTSGTTKALQYQSWMEAAGNGSQDVTSNAFVDNAVELRAPLVALLQARGPVCWDAAFYLEHNPDLVPGGITTADLAWQHYITSGQFEGRASRYTCDPYKPPSV